MFRGLGFRVDVSGFRVRISKKNIGFRIDVLGFVFQKKRFRIDGLGFRVEF